MNASSDSTDQCGSSVPSAFQVSVTWRNSRAWVSGVTSHATEMAGMSSGVRSETDVGSWARNSGDAQNASRSSATEPRWSQMDVLVRTRFAAEQQAVCGDDILAGDRHGVLENRVNEA